ncbi:hypothetical protein [Nocardioides pantholopis]|uniref:hypothetical protein n=1 Tax=Nocardioides pantholopis TaxID=2483798 RepID=UPI000F094DC9|nr:hypothetical protein [Nocardioides pantholopis]
MATLVVAATAAAGLSSFAEPAAAAPPEGGCWSYAPTGQVPPVPVPPTVPPTPPTVPPESADLSEDPVVDHSTELEPWSLNPDVDFALTTGGPTVVGRERTVTLTIPEGPVVSPTLLTSGTATFHLAVNGTDIEPIEADFTVEAGEPITDLVATGTFPIATSGAQVVTLRAAFFDAPLLLRRVACNGQTEGVPGAINPATTPLDTKLTTAFTSVATSGGTLTSVTGQQLTTAARPGDTLLFTTTGFASGSEGSALGSAQLCGADGTCTDPTTFPTNVDGVGGGRYVVPGTAPVGPVDLRLSDGDQIVQIPLTVLGGPAIGGEERSGTRRSIVTVTGTGWDPGREVTLQGLTGRSITARVGDDEKVAATPGSDGSLESRFVVSDRDIRSLRATQQRPDGSRLVALAAVEGPLPAGDGPVDDGDEKGNDDGNAEGGDTQTPADPGATTTLPPAAATPLVIPPLAIPQPLPLPFEMVDQPPLPAPVPPEPTPLDLVVSDPRLDGSVSFGELFGGAPERTLTFDIENRGEATVTEPVIAIAIGRSSDLEPSQVEAEVPALEPGETATVTVAVALPAASFGTYHVVGQVGEGDDGAFTLPWVTYPYGLFLLNLLGAGLLGYGVRRRLRSRPSPRLLPAPVLAAREVPALTSEAVVDLTRLEAWWQIKDKGVRPPAKPVLPALAAALPAFAIPGGRPAAPAEDAVVDLDAADLWWRRQLDTPGAALEDAVVDLDAAEKWWSQSRGGASTRA